MQGVVGARGAGGGSRHGGVGASGGGGSRLQGGVGARGAGGARLKGTVGPSKAGGSRWVDGRILSHLCMLRLCILVILHHLPMQHSGVLPLLHPAGHFATMPVGHLDSATAAPC